MAHLLSCLIIQPAVDLLVMARIGELEDELNQVDLMVE